MNTSKHPGIYIPPPLIYVAFFLSSFLLQRAIPLDNGPLHGTPGKIAGILLLLLYFLLFITSMRKFLLTKNTLVTIRPARSLETSGIYSLSRNPMYLSLLCRYCGLAIFFGNWWTLILSPVLITVVQLYVIRREEHYLQQAFGPEYRQYKDRVRRWI